MSLTDVFDGSLDLNDALNLVLLFFREGSIGSSLASQKLALGHRLLALLAERSTISLIFSPLFFSSIIFSVVPWFCNCFLHIGFSQPDFGDLHFPLRLIFFFLFVKVKLTNLFFCSPFYNFHFL